MSNRVHSPRSFPNNVALAIYRRVVIAAGKLAYATKNQRSLGVMEKPTQTTDTVGSVQLFSDDRTKICIASGAIPQFARVYADDNGKVSASGSVYEGMALEAAANDGDELEVLNTPDPHEKLFTQVAPSSAITNTNAETAFDQSFTIPANTLQAGDRIRIRAQVIATATNSTDTLTVKLKIGATVIIATAAVDVANSDIAFIDADLVVRTSGANGTIIAAGTQGLGTLGTVTAKPFNLASTAIDTTADQAVTLSATWSVANAGDSCRLDLLDIERLAA